MESAPSEDGLTDVVKIVHWRRVCEVKINQKKYIAEVFGAMECSAPDPISFKPYNDLTFDEVCSWLKANLNVKALDSNLDQQIENQVNPITITLPLPF